MIDLKYSDALLLAQMRYLACTSHHRFLRHVDKETQRMICACGLELLSIGSWAMHVQNECGVPIE